jgi:hypothetical protein
MLSTTADCTPTLLCLQARKEIFLGLEGLVFERMIQVANTGNKGKLEVHLCALVFRQDIFFLATG